MSNPQRLRFLLNSDDHARVVANSIVLEPDAGRAEILRVGFRLDAGAPARVMPLFEAELRYLPVEPGTIVFPQIAGPVAAWTPAGYAGLPVRGTLMITPRPASARAILANLDGLFGEPFPTPRALWIWPVTLPREFFADFFNVPVARRHQVIEAGNRTVQKGANDWPQFAAAEFLRGGATAIVEFDSADPLNDEAITRRMPEFVADGAGNVEFRIAIATRRENEHDPKDALQDLAAGRSKIDPTHPINALIHAHWALRQLGDVPIGAEAGVPLADQIIRGANPPGFDVIRFSTPGASETRIFHSGELARANLTLSRRLIGSVLRELNLSTNGWLVLPQETTAAGVNRANINADFGNALRYTQTNANRPGFMDGITGFDFDDGTYGTGHAYAVVQPPAPVRANDADRRAYSARLASPAFRWGRSPEIESAVAAELDRVAGNIQPPGWPAGQLFYPGTRDPKSDVTERDIRTLFDALQKIDIGVPNAPRVRPGEAMCLWIMEGKLAAKRRLPPPPLADAYVAGRPSRAFNAELLAATPGAGLVGTAANIRAADPAHIRSMVRSFYLWSFFGLDAFAATVLLPAINDVALNWGTDIPDGAAINDQRFRNGLAGLRAAGFAVPTEAEINGTIAVRRVAGRLEVRLSASFVERTLWLQYSEYLRRIQVLEAGPNAAASAYPAFRYMTYNASPQALSDLWAEANAILADPARPAWVTNLELALRVERIPASELRINPATGDAFIRSGNHRVRSIAIRFGIIHSHYGTVFPFLLEP